MHTHDTSSTDSFNNNRAVSFGTQPEAILAALSSTEIFQFFQKGTAHDADYFTEVKNVCMTAANLSCLIANMFSLYTKHDITHICNVLNLMASLLHDRMKDLSVDEAALLLMAACWHDTGMAVNKKQAERLLSEDDEDIWNNYFRTHNEDKRRYHEGTADKKTLLPNLIRSFHHERVKEQLMETGLWYQWPEAIDKHIAREELFSVCKSHGEKLQVINEIQPRSRKVDLRVCAVLLRLADILDFDYSRAPQSLYYYSGLANPKTSEERFSQLEWQKHMKSYGFDFIPVYHEKNIVELSLLFNATCEDPTAHHKVNEYIDWVEYELGVCNAELAKYSSKWENRLALPYKVERHIHANGFEVGDFSFHVDKGRIIELLKGNNIYNNKGVFIRELIQNALDAVRTRRQIEKNSFDWKPEINIYSWTADGFNWLSIDDNGIGMSREIIKNYFLRIGCSYYESDEFKAAFGNEDYKPTSHFGIGILSCFISSNNNSRIEVSTKHYQDTDGRETLRLSIPSQQGYYYLATEADNRDYISKGTDDITIPPVNSLKKDSGYRKKPGTTISVRFSIGEVQTQNAITIKDIIDTFVAFPDVPIHYYNLDNGEQSDYLTEEDFQKSVESACTYDENGFSETFEYVLPDEIFDRLKEYYPEAQWTDTPMFQTEFLHLKKIAPFKEDSCIDGILMMVKRPLNKPVICSFPQSKYMKVFFAYLNYKVFRQEVELFVTASVSDAVYNMLVHTRNALIAASAGFAPESDAAEICSAILDGRYYKEKWRIKFSKTHGICESDLYKMTANALQNYIEPDDLQEYLVFQKYEYAWGWKYRFDPLIPSFKTFFHRTFSMGYDFLWNDNRLSYNGIYIGGIHNMNLNPDGWDLIASTILLKDMHRPDLSVNRFGIDNLPLELTCMEASLQMHLKHARRDVLHLARGYNFDATLDDFRKVLRASPSLAECLYINTWGGTFRWHEIARRLQQGKPIILSIVHLNAMVIRLSIAVLLEYFDVRFEIRQAHHPVISVYLKNGLAMVAASALPGNFPPGMFLYTIDRKTKYLSAGTGENFAIYNADHPFSKWLISNSNLMEEKSPGTLKAFCNCMALGIVAENCDRKRMDEINGLLRMLKNHKGIPVPDNVFLKSSDFLSLDKASDSRLK